MAELLHDVWQFLFEGSPASKSVLYMFWLVFTGAACLWAASFHTGEKDYQGDAKDDMDIW